jgi:hypothetical protein
MVSRFSVSVILPAFFSYRSGVLGVIGTNLLRRHGKKAFQPSPSWRLRLRRFLFFKE